MREKMEDFREYGRMVRNTKEIRGPEHPTKRKLITREAFTLAELLITVAIIAVIVAIAIPILRNQLEKSREATDAANIRAQYADIMSKAVESSGDINKNGEDNQFGKIQLKQKKDGWSTKSIEDGLSDIMSVKPGAKPIAQATAWVEYIDEEATAYLCYGDSSGKESSTEIDWSTSPLKKAGETMLKLLKGTPGINRHTLYSSNYSDFTEDQKSIVANLKKYMNLDKDYAIYYDWTGYPGIRCTVTTSVSKEGTTGPFEYATRISFDKNGNVTKVVKEYGAWQYWNGKWGFHANDTVKGVKYPTETLYEKK